VDVVWKKIRGYLVAVLLGAVLGAAGCYLAGSASDRELRSSLAAASTDARDARSALAATIRDLGLAERDRERLAVLNERERELGVERDRLLAREREYNRRIADELGRLVASTGRSLERARTAAELVGIIDELCHKLYGIYGGPPGGPRPGE